MYYPIIYAFAEINEAGFGVGFLPQIIMDFCCNWRDPDEYSLYRQLKQR